MQEVYFSGVIGTWQIVIILVVVVLLFGATKIPQLMKGVGEGMKEFKKAQKDMKEDDEPQKPKQDQEINQ